MGATLLETAARLTPASATRQMPSGRRLRQLAAAAAVCALLAVTLGVRTWGLPGAGLLYYDEGWAARDGRLVVEMLAQPRDWPRILHAWVTADWGDWKPGHDLILGTLMAVGVPPDYLPWLSGFAGAVLVLALAAVAWRRWGPPAGAVAGVFAGTVPLGIIYGHHVLAEADGLAGLAVALYLWDRWWERPASRPLAVATTAAFLVTLSLNYRLTPSLLPLLIMGAWRLRDRGVAPLVHWRRRLLGVCLAPSVAIVLVYLLILAASRLAGIAQVPPWVESLIRPGSGLPVPFEYPDFYPRTLWEFGGPAFAGAVALGLVSMIRRRHLLDHLETAAIGTLAGAILFFTAVHDKAPRAMAVGIPFAALIAARGLTLWQARRWQWTVAAAICAACLITGWTGSGPAREANGIGAAGRWLAAHPGGIVADRAPTVALYVDPAVRQPAERQRLRPIVQPPGYRTLSDLRQAGVRWAVVDADTWILPWSSVARTLASCAQPVAEFDDPASWTRIWFLDGADTRRLGYDGMLAVRDAFLAATAGKMQISIYDLAGEGTRGCLH